MIAFQDVLQFSYGAEASLKKRKRQDGSTEYTVIARHNPLTGRIEAETGDAEGGPDDALYRECISWCNPVEYEKYLQQVGPVYNFARCLLTDAYSLRQRYNRIWSVHFLSVGTTCWHCVTLGFAMGSLPVICRKRRTKGRKAHRRTGKY
jgi:hypothetical protein